MTRWVDFPTNGGRDLGWHIAVQRCDHHGTTEVTVSDDKSKCNGWSLRDTKITKPDRIDRLLLILLDKIDVSPPDAFEAVSKLSKSVVPNWG